MCGFAGMLNPVGQAVDTARLRQMAELQRHRGPDGEGFLRLDTRTGRAIRSLGAPDEGACNLGFAFRRLAVIDLSDNGAQPMCNADGTIWLVFNGEVYNYVELRAALDEPVGGYRGHSDTEVLLALYEQRGLAGLSELNGMFAFVLWDQRRQRLVLARDRVGIKPLYYAQTGGGLLFASEIKPLLVDPRLPRQLDLHGFIEHFTYQFTLGERTLHKGISQLDPGTAMIVARDGVRRERFWRLTF